MFFNEDQVKHIVNILRGNNNIMNNCTHLASDLIEYFKTGINPRNPSSITPSTLKDFNVLITTNWIKQEDENEYLGITRSVVCLDKTIIPSIPCDMEPRITSDGIYDIDSEPIYNIDKFTQPSILVSELNDHLRMKAEEN